MDRICGTLAGAGHTVTLVGRKLPDSLPLGERPYATRRLACRHRRGKRFYAEYNYRLRRAFSGRDYDAINAVDLDTLAAGVALTVGRRAKLVFDAHEWFSETPEVVHRPLVQAAWRNLGRLLVPRTDARYTVAPGLADLLAYEYGVPFATVRNAPPLARSAPPAVGFPHTERRVLLYQGMLNPGRGLAEAVTALAQLPDYELWIVGHGPEEGAVRRRIAETGTGDRVWLAGFRPPHELPAFTERAWLGLNLLAAGSPSYYHSLANKAFDYPHAGRPSVQMRYPEYERLQRQYGCYFLLPELAAPALVATVRQVGADPAAYARAQRGCDAFRAAVNWEAEAVRLVKIYEGLA